MRRTGIVLTGTLVGQGSLMLASPLVTRLYAPEQLGALAVFTSVAAVLGTLSLLRLDSVILLPRSERAAVSAVALAVSASTVIGIFLAVLGLVVAAPLAERMNAPDLRAQWPLLCVTVVLIAFAQILGSWLGRRGDYTGLGIRAGAQGLGQTVTQLVSGIFGATTTGLLASLGAGYALSLGGMTGRGGLAKRPKPRLRLMVGVLSRYRRFPLVFSWSALLNSVGQHAPLVIVSALFGQLEVGLFALCIRVLASPVAVIGQALGKVFQAESAEDIRNATPALHRRVRHTAVLLAGCASPLVIAVLLFGPQLFSVAFGNPWAVAGEYARYLVLSYLLQFIASPLSSLLLLTESQGVQLSWDISRTMLVIVAPLVVHESGGDAQAVIMAIATSQGLMYGLLLMLCLRSARVHDRACFEAKSREAVS